MFQKYQTVRPQSIYIRQPISAASASTADEYRPEDVRENDCTYCVMVLCTAKGQTLTPVTHPNKTCVGASVQASEVPDPDGRNIITVSDSSTPKVGI